MDIGDWPATRGFNELYRELRQRGLEPRIAELEAFGFTVIPDVLEPASVSRLRDRMIELTESELGVTIDRTTGLSVADGKRVSLWYPLLLARCPEFCELAANPVVLAVVRYLLGLNCTLSAVTAFIKGPMGSARAVHCDDESPDPLPRYAQVANVHWLMSDHSAAAGTLTMVPGSHRMCRSPGPDAAGEDLVPVDARAGSVIIFHGHTWHGSCARRDPGLRLAVATYFNRGMYRWQYEAYREILPPEVVARYGPDFRKVLGFDVPWYWRERADRDDSKVADFSATKHLPYL